MPEGEALQRLEPFFTAQTLAADNFPPVDPTDRRSLLLPLLLSLLVHGVLLGVFMVFATMPRTLIEPDNFSRSVQIRIVPSPMPVVVAEVIDASVDQTPVDESPGDESPVDQTPVDESPVDESPVEQAASVSVPIINEEVAERLSDAALDLATAPRPLLQLPSSSGLRQLVKEFSENENAMSLADCNRLQQENPLISCGETEKDLRQLDRNFVYDYFNPLSEPRRSAASVNIIAAQTSAVEQRMRAAGVNAALSDFLLYNQAVSDEDYRGSAPRPEKRLTDVLNMNDRTYQMIKKTMGE